MTLKELINQVTKTNKDQTVLDLTNPILDYEIEVYDLDLEKFLDKDSIVFVQHDEHRIKINVEG